MKISKHALIISLGIFFAVIFLTIGFSAFGQKLRVTDISAEVRMKKDVRISSVAVSNETNGAVVQNSDYNYNKIYGNIKLLNNTSTITYDVEVTNLGNTKVGIANITGLDSNLKYTISDYTLGQIINQNGQATLGVTQKFKITIGYADGVSASEKIYPVELNFDFQPVYSITYSGVTGTNLPTEVVGKMNTEATLNNIVKIDRLTILMGNVLLQKDVNYTYDETTRKLVIKDVTGNLQLSYKDKTYLASLASDTAYFKESAYKTKIQNIYFVDYVDITGAVKTYDLSESKDNSVTGWLKANGSNYDLYIGSVYKLYTKDLQRAFKEMTGVTNISFGNLNTSENTSLYYTFAGMSNLTSLDLKNFDTSKVTSMKITFRDCYNLQTLDISSFDTRNVTSMYSMFSGCNSLTNLDLSHFNTEKVTDMSAMFMGCDSLIDLNISQFITNKVTSMEQMFRLCKSLKNIDVSNFDTSSVEIMSNMFNNCISLETLDISNFVTSKVTKMNSMFFYCSKLRTINFGNLDTSGVTTMYHMFMNCSSLSDLNLKSFDTTNVTTMEGMFCGCNSLTNLDITNFRTPNLTMMNEMFNECRNLKEINLSYMNTEKVTRMDYLFNLCTNLVSVNLTNINTDQVTDMSNMFNNCASLESLDISNFDTSKVTEMNSMFLECRGLTNLDFRNATFTNVTNAETMFDSIPANIRVIVKDTDAKTWIQDKLGTGKGTVIMVSEL